MFDRFQLFLVRASTLSLRGLRREEGQTTSEYAIMVAVAAALAIGAYVALGAAIGSVIAKVSTYVSGITIP